MVEVVSGMILCGIGILTVDLPFVRKRPYTYIYAVPISNPEWISAIFLQLLKPCIGVSAITGL